MRAKQFLFYIDDKPVTPSRFLEDHRTRADMEAEPTEVPMREGRTLAVKFVPVRLKRSRDPRTFVAGEMTPTGLMMTHYVETPMSCAAADVVSVDGEVPFRVVPGTNTAQLFVEEGMGAVPAFTVVDRQPEQPTRRHILIGDFWRGSIWTHSLRVIPARRSERPRRVRACYY